MQDIWQEKDRETGISLVEAARQLGPVQVCYTGPMYGSVGVWVEAITTERQHYTEITPQWFFTIGGGEHIDRRRFATMEEAKQVAIASVISNFEEIGRNLIQKAADLRMVI